MQGEGQAIFKDWALSQQPRDIENLNHLGKSLGTCPYYGSRAAAGAADVVPVFGICVLDVAEIFLFSFKVCIPYPSLVHKATRDSLGLCVKGREKQANLRNFPTPFFLL